jgi:hypothetical protein
LVVRTTVRRWREYLESNPYDVEATLELDTFEPAHQRPFFTCGEIYCGVFAPSTLTAGTLACCRHYQE